ncbi:MAG: hypothetical protein AAFX40_18425, partial [Cyanobacteria bacterium J06639_1]
MTNAIATPSLLAAWLAGLTLAVAFQLVFANVGVAVGLSAFSLRRNESRTDESDAAGDRDETTTSLPIGWLAGSGVAIGLASVLFGACWSAAKLSGVPDGVSGALLGLWIWATYWLALTWTSAQVAGSAIASLFGAATFGFDKLVQLTRSLGDDEASKQTPNSERTNAIDAAEARALARQEFDAALNALEREFSERFPEVRDTAIASRPDRESDKREAFTATAQVDAALTNWKQTGATPAKMWRSLANQIDGRAIAKALLSRADVSDWDLQRLWETLHQVWPDAPEPETLSLSATRSDIATFVAETDWSDRDDCQWHDTFREVICDREADPSQMADRVRLLERSHGFECLQQVEDLTDADRNAIADEMETIRLEVLADLTDRAARQQLASARDRAQSALACCQRSICSAHGRESSQVAISAQSSRSQCRTAVSMAGSTAAVAVRTGARSAGASARAKARSRRSRA